MEGIGTGITMAFTTALANYAPQIESFNLDGEEISVVDFTHMGTTGYREKKFGSLIEPPQVNVEIQYDPANPPPLGTLDTVTITWPDSSTLIGTGALISRSSEHPNEDKMSSSFVFQFDGQTGPTYA